MPNDDEWRRLAERAEAERARTTDHLATISQGLATIINLIGQQQGDLGRLRQDDATEAEIFELRETVALMHTYVVSLHEASPMGEVMEALTELLDGLSEQTSSASSNPRQLTASSEEFENPLSPQTPEPTPPGRAERILEMVSHPKRAAALTKLLYSCVVVLLSLAGLCLVLGMQGDDVLRLLGRSPGLDSPPSLEEGSSPP
jgi:hypothetical protein